MRNSNFYISPTTVGKYICAIIFPFPEILQPFSEAFGIFLKLFAFIQSNEEVFSEKERKRDAPKNPHKNVNNL